MPQNSWKRKGFLSCETMLRGYPLSFWLAKGSGDPLY